MDGIERYNGGIEYTNSGDILADAKAIIESSQGAAHRTVNVYLVMRNWLLGRRIAEEELAGEGRAEYGLEVIKELSARLSKEYGAGFDRSNLYQYLQFFKCFPEIVDALRQQSQKNLS